MAERLETHAYSISKAHHAALNALGERRGSGNRGGASQALREILDGNAETLAELRAALDAQQNDEAAA